MRPPIIIGIVIGVVVLAAALLAPQFRSGPAKAAVRAREQAALASRLLHRHDVQLPVIDRLLDPSALKGAKPDVLLEAVGAQLRTLNQEFSGILSQMKTRAGGHGLSAPTAQALTPDARGLTTALEHYQAALKANADLLDQAAKIAKEAGTGEGAGVLGVPDIAGLAEQTRAVSVLAEAQVLRQEQQRLQSRLLRLVAQWNAYRASQDYLAGLDVREIVRALRADLEEVRQRSADAVQQVEALGADVSQREQELARVTANLNQARQERLALEQRGFKAGDDKDFDAYRVKYVELSDQLRTLEADEQLLSVGGLRSANFEGDDLQTAKISGNEVVGLDELKRRLALGQERSRRLTAAVGTLQEQIGFVEQAGESAKQGQDYYAKLLSELDVAQKEIVPPLLELAKKASAKESEALQAIRAAVSSFDAAQQAADKWLASARELQSTKDPERANPRLKMMVGDPTNPSLGSSAKAAALMLTGRIYAQRIDADQSLINDMKLFVEMRPETEFKPEAFEEEIRIARDEAIKKVTDAVGIYKKLSERGSQNTKWVPQAGLAAAYHLLARVNPAESATLLASALQAVDDAVKGKEQSPYLDEHVRFRDHLRALTSRGTPPPEGEPPAGGTEPPKDGG